MKLLARLPSLQPSPLALALLLTSVSCGFAACSKGNEGGAGSGDGDGDTSEGGAGGLNGEEVDTTTRTYDADDERIQYMGRFDFADPKAPKTTAPAAQFTIRFSGDGVTVRMRDQFRYGKYRNHFDVVVDGEIVTKVALEQGEDSI